MQVIENKKKIYLWHFSHSHVSLGWSVGVPQSFGRYFLMIRPILGGAVLEISAGVVVLAIVDPLICSKIDGFRYIVSHVVSCMIPVRKGNHHIARFL